jgi:aryl-alcohol dehydrogenase-like predicted oxidoreductase
MPAFARKCTKTRLTFPERLAARSRTRRTAEAKSPTLRDEEAAVLAKGLANGNDIVPLIGARKRSQLEESLGAVAIHLTADDLAQIEELVPLRSRSNASVR